MEIDALLCNVERKARLHGRRESLRVVTGVLGAVTDVLPVRASELLAPHLPTEIRTGLARHTRTETPASCRPFLERITALLYVDQPDNAFLARVALENLNASLHVISPAAFAHMVAADLRPLLLAGRPAVTRTQPAVAVTDRIRVPAVVPA
ncbi:DUF2267 domain-containing protein [Actinoplanes couchii]|uniref:Uncharacterized protein n=1 Tax=Actinoplanes couchii TaxID=403638 RepID=A0ABQ3X8I8_9ACTN|nr:DUF2267 domain-containing protein [Actinoplanes couchii]MDR6320152.1 uncharacterized protein (DUF2267 family) [Actinoplanes couchii]GID54834.1 hypothetical protein Aco03nite_032380 [Actinoplanes couchii]